jgi:hypothetical protein
MGNFSFLGVISTETTDRPTDDLHHNRNGERVNRNPNRIASTIISLLDASTTTDRRCDQRDDPACSPTTDLHDDHDQREGQAPTDHADDEAMNDEDGRTTRPGDQGGDERKGNAATPLPPSAPKNEDSPRAMRLHRVPTACACFLLAIWLLLLAVVITFVASMAGCGEAFGGLDAPGCVWMNLEAPGRFVGVLRGWGGW